MQINKISTVTYTIPCRGITTPKTILHGANNISKDTFQKIETPFNFKEEIDKFHNKILNASNYLSEKDIFLLTKKLSQKFNIPYDDVLNSINKITQFSSYKCIPQIVDEFKKRGIYEITNLDDVLPSPQNQLQPNLNMLFKYLTKNLRLNYIKDKKNKAIILDSELLNYLKELPEKEFSDFKNNIKTNKIKLVYIPNFENSYNIFNQHNTLSEYSEKIFQQIRVKDKNILQNIENQLNNDNLDLLENLELPYETLNIASEGPATTASITKQINSILPSSSKIEECLENASEEFDNKEAAKKCFLEFLNEMTVVISPYKYSEEMKNLHKNIMNFVTTNNKNPNNIYYIVPNTTKSFITALYMYKKANNLGNIKLFYPDENLWYNNYYDLNKLPKNSTAILLDDCAISGASMVYEQFDYAALRAYNHRQDLSIILAPMLITKQGKKNIEDLMQNIGKKDIDALISSKKLPYWDTSTRDKENYLDTHIKNKYLTSLLFPYMGPDTNCRKLLNLYQEFFSNRFAQKSTTANLEFQIPIF